MSDRTVHFDEDATCDSCGAKGALDFMGDMRCIVCISHLPNPNHEDLMFTAPKQRSENVLVDDGECCCFLSESSMPNMVSLAFRDGGGFSSCLITEEDWVEIKKRGDEFFDRLAEKKCDGLA